MAIVSKTIIEGYNNCAALAVKFKNILDSFWHKGEKIPFSALEQAPITDVSNKVDKIAGKQLSKNDYTTGEKTEVATISNKVDKVNGKTLSTNDYTAADKTQVGTISNKVDKILGKQLSENDYTTAEKEKLADLKQIWEETPNGNTKTATVGKLAIHKEEAEYVLDVANVPDIETPLTGTISFDGMMITGIGTAFLSELNLNGEDTIKVISTGEIYRVGAVFSDTKGMANGLTAFNNEACVIAKQNANLLNFMDVIKLYRNQYDLLEKENNEHYAGNNQISIKRNSAQKGAGHYNIEDTVNLADNTGYQKRFLSSFGGISIRFNKQNGIAVFTVATQSGYQYITIDSDGKITIVGLPTSAPTGSNQLYKDSNGFLKIG